MSSPKSASSSYPSPPLSPFPSNTAYLTQTATIHNLTIDVTLLKKQNDYLNSQVLYLQVECKRLEEDNKEVEEGIETLKERRRRLKDENTRLEAANEQLREVVARQQALLDALVNTMQLQVGVFGSVLT
ncbi:hypothetical protein BGZ60DRAFT_76597 [Tricladium varicosporioides]|nr:hypothetical protein BGZ60DRAFT_76597 [Hymenoscyphus varicosporioides]